MAENEETTQDAKEEEDVITNEIVTEKILDLPIDRL